MLFKRLQQLQQRPPCPNWLFSFLLLSWLHLLWLTHGFFSLGLPDPQWDMAGVFHVTAWAFYALLYLLPVGVAGAAAWIVTHEHHAIKIWLVYALSVVLVLLLHVDLLIYSLYSFHFNAFVWNLIMTPGGIGSLGSSSSTQMTAGLLAVKTLAIQAALLWLSRKASLLCTPGKAAYRRAAAVALLLFVVQGVTYGFGDLAHNGPVLDGSKAYPLFQRIRFRSLARKFGVTVEQDSAPHLAVTQATLRYPLQPATYQPVEKMPNVILLVAESLRWDQLSPEIMPNTWQFGLTNTRFAQHYSSGNGTREALFGMFYGLYGSYWEKFLHARQSPLLMDRLQALSYQFDLRTSAVFTYPEFDKTLFTNVPADLLHESGDALPPWQRDQQNMDSLLQFLAQRDTSRPFMSFFFLESSHASYSFPETNPLFSDYLEDVDYMALKKDKLAVSITPMLNRYHNAANWIDSQLGRLYTELEKQNLLDSTIVIFTGDHGEEFMEKGAWGHNSSFVEEQTHVPLVVHMPGRSSGVIDTLTTHLDISTTLLQQLGISNPVADYSLGRNLFDTSERSHLVLSDWHSISVLTPKLKYRIPYLNAGVESWDPTDPMDRPLDKERAATLLVEEQHLILDAMNSFSTYTSSQ